MWLRMCVAFGVLSGFPVPTGDPLASLRAERILRLHGSTEPGLATRGRLDRRLHRNAAATTFTSLPLTARYGIGTGRRLPPARERLAKHSGGGSGSILAHARKAGTQKVSSL